MSRRIDKLKIGQKIQFVELGYGQCLDYSYPTETILQIDKKKSRVKTEYGWREIYELL